MTSCYCISFYISDLTWDLWFSWLDAPFWQVELEPKYTLKWANMVSLQSTVWTCWWRRQTGTSSCSVRLGSRAGTHPMSTNSGSLKPPAYRQDSTGSSCTQQNVFPLKYSHTDYDVTFLQWEVTWMISEPRPITLGCENQFDENPSPLCSYWICYFNMETLFESYR